MSSTTEPQAAPIVKSEAPNSLSQLGFTRHGIQLSTIDDLYRFAKAVVVGGLAPKGFEKPESVFIAIQMGMELGISPMAALQNIGVINGKPKIYGSMPLALVRASGLLEWIKETIEGQGDSRQAICVTKRRGESDPKTTTFSVAQAKAAQLWGKDIWVKYPDRMLMYRARGFNLDDNFSDVLKGLAAHEDVIDLPPESTQVTTIHSEPGAPIVEVKAEPTGFRVSKAYQKMRDGFRNGAWDSVEVHLSNPAFPIKGKTLAQIQVNMVPEAFDFLLNKWEPVEKDGKIPVEDLALRSALDAAKEDLAIKNSKPSDAPKFDEKGMSKDDIKF